MSRLNSNGGNVIKAWTLITLLSSNIKRGISYEMTLALLTLYP